MRSAAKDRWLFTSCSRSASRYMCCSTNVTSAPRSAGLALAWLSPILGSILYAIFGINRVKRRANQLRDKRPGRHAAEPPISPAGRDDHLAPLERAGDRITQHRAERGNAVTVLHNGDEAYPKMIAAIEAAKASIALSSYIFRADDAGGALHRRSGPCTPTPRPSACSDRWDRQRLFPFARLPTATAT